MSETQVQLPDPNDPNWYAQQPGESQEAWITRTQERSKRETLWRNYEEYQEVIDEVLGSYRTQDGEKLDRAEVIDTVASWIYDMGQTAAEEREEELKDNASETAAEIAQTEDWKEYDPDDDDEEEGE